MHLMKGIEDRCHSRSYHNKQVLTRPDSLAYLFRKLRIHRNMTKRALAEKFSVSEKYVYEVENGYRFPSLRYCLRCGEFFGANSQWVRLQWARQAIDRYADRVYRRLHLERWGGWR